MSVTKSTFKLYKSLIYETVKNETHISAHVARAMDKNASELAFQEEAGDEAYHERKLERTLFSSLDKIKAEIIGYLNTESDSSNNLTCTMNGDEITFTMTLSSRFNTSYLTPLADLISKYVEDTMLFDWWTPINANNAKMYSEKAELDRQSVLKCFIKNAPSASNYSYANVRGGTDIASSTKGISVVAAKNISVGDTIKLPYTLTGLQASDISVSSSSATNVSTGTVAADGVTINGLVAGTSKITIYYKDDASVNSICYVTVQ